jgi:hypothetical protein
MSVTIISLTVLSLIGAGVGSVMPWPPTPQGEFPLEVVLTRVGIAVLSGAAVLMAVGSTLAVAGITVPTTLEAGSLVATSVIVVVACQRAHRGHPAGAAFGDSPLGRRAALASVSTGVQVIAVIVLTAGLVVWIRACSFHPNQSWDAVVMWGTKSRALHYANGLGSPVFTSAQYRYMHQDYPIGVPVLESLVSGLGAPVTRGAIGLLAALPLAATAVLYGTVRRQAPVWVAASISLGFLGMPLLVTNAAAGLADAVVASFLVVAVAAAWRWMEEGHSGWLRVFAVAGIGLVLAKDEGVALLLALLAATAIALAIRRTRPDPRAVVAAVVPLAVLAPWRLWVGVHGIPTSFLDAGSVKDAAGFLAGIATVTVATVRSASHPGHYGLVWPAAIGLGTWRAIRRGSEQPFFWAAFGLSTLGFVVVNGLDANYLIATALNRNLIDVSAILVVWVAASVSACFTQQPRRAENHPGGASFTPP